VIAGGDGRVAALGMAMCTVGVFGLSTVGFGGLLAGKAATMIVAPVTAPVTIAMIALGAALTLRRPALTFRRPAGGS
jgi:hypothetical protein